MGKKHKFYEKGAGKRKRRRDDEASEDEEGLELEDVPQASKHNVEVRWRMLSMPLKLALMLVIITDEICKWNS